MRVLACVLLAALCLFVPAAAATPAGLKLLLRDGGRLSLLYVDRASAASARISGYSAQANASFVTVWFKP